MGHSFRCEDATSCDVDGPLRRGSNGPAVTPRENQRPRATGKRLPMAANHRLITPETPDKTSVRVHLLPVLVPGLVPAHAVTAHIVVCPCGIWALPRHSSHRPRRHDLHDRSGRSGQTHTRPLLARGAAGPPTLHRCTPRVPHWLSRPDPSPRPPHPGILLA